MFGDRTLLGTYEVSVDSKNRIILPAKTGREVGEELVLAYDEDLKKYFIYKLSDVEDKIKYYEDIIEITSSEEEIVKLKSKEYEYAKRLKDILTVEKQGRIKLNSDLGKYKKLILIGCGNNIYIEPGNEKKTKTK